MVLNDLRKSMANRYVNSDVITCYGADEIDSQEK